MQTLKQVGALPIRKTDAGIEVLLVTSRDTGRWVIPKGWPMKRLPDHKAAAREAMEEAGVEGDVIRKPLGSYTYFKRQTETFELIEVAVYLLAVDNELKRWPEMTERRKQWMKPADAARAVLEPGLAALIETLGGPLSKKAHARLKLARKRIEKRAPVSKTGACRKPARGKTPKERKPSDSPKMPRS